LQSLAVATLGQIALLIQKQAPVDLELIEMWLENRYRQVLDAVPWHRTEARIVLGLAAEFSTGTIAVLNGSTSVTLTDGEFTQDMNGRAIRFPDHSVIYTFNYVSATTGELDRAYEGTSAAATAFTMHVRVLDLPANTRLITTAKRSDGRDLDVLTKHEFRIRQGFETGQPRRCCWTNDGPNNLPRIEIYPLPVEAASLDLELISEGAIDGEDKGHPLDTWMNPALLEAGVMVNVSRHLEKWQAVDSFITEYNTLLTAAIAKATEHMGPIKVRGDVKPHRVARWAR
jgi:hypothetical protein